MVGLMTKLIYISTVTKREDGWLISTDVEDIGLIHALAVTDEEIDLMARQNICSFTDHQPFDFDIHYEFPGEAPRLDQN